MTPDPILFDTRDRDHVMHIDWPMAPQVFLKRAGYSRAYILDSTAAPRLFKSVSIDRIFILQGPT